MALCNFTVMYFFPTWFQTVALTSSSVAGQCACKLWHFLYFFSLMTFASSTGLHLMPNGLSMSAGSMFAGYV